MGEEYMYTEMEQEINLASLHDDAAREELRVKAEMAKMREFASMPKDAFVGPFYIKDVVCHVDKQMMGKVIGLPTFDDVKAGEDFVDKAWVYFTDASRAWVPFDKLSMVRRSPIKRPRVETPAPRSIQTKLFLTSRSTDLGSSGTASGSSASPIDADNAAPAQHERDRKNSLQLEFVVVKRLVSIFVRLRYRLQSACSSTPSKACETQLVSSSVGPAKPCSRT